MKRVYIGLVGFGKVGSAVVKTLQEKRLFLRKKLGLDLTVKRICDKDVRSKRRIVKLDSRILTKNINLLLNDPQIDIIVELIGGVNPAKEIIEKALKAKKHVVTANKALLSTNLKNLFKIAKSKEVELRFEASVAGGIPIIKALNEGLSANKISSLFGIINGTSNYILSHMQEENLEFSTALRQAKGRGFAERNPMLDINGVDSAHKLAILAYLGFGKSIDLDKIYVEGIREVSLSDIKYADELGYRVKLLAIAKRKRDELEARVHPTLISKSHLLANVRGAYNAIYVYGDLVGQMVFYGQGAGQFAAASAVISDLIELAQDIGNKNIPAALNPDFDSGIKKIKKIEHIDSRYYIRFMAIDKPGVLAKISGVLGKNHISIASVNQKERGRARVVPIVMMTHEANEKNIRLALKEIDKLGIIHAKCVAIRVENI